MSVSLIDGHIDDDGQMTDEEIIKAFEEKVNLIASMTSVYLDENEGQALYDAMDDARLLIKRQKAEIENLRDILYDADGVNLVNYWHQQCKIAENGCKNFAEENESQKAEIERLQNDLSTWKDIAHRETSYVSIDKAEAVKEFAARLKEKFACLEYVIQTNRKTLPVERVKAEVDAVLQNGCLNVVDKVLKEMVGE